MKSLKQTEATTALTLDSTKQKTSVKQCKFILFDVIKSIGNDNDFINIIKQMTSTNNNKNNNNITNNMKSIRTQVNKSNCYSNSNTKFN